MSGGGGDGGRRCDDRYVRGYVSGCVKVVWEGVLREGVGVYQFAEEGVRVLSEE